MCHSSDICFKSMRHIHFTDVDMDTFNTVALNFKFRVNGVGGLYINN